MEESTDLNIRFTRWTFISQCLLDIRLKALQEIREVRRNQIDGHGSKTSWICRSSFCLCSLMWPRVAFVKRSVDNSKEQNGCFFENNAPLPFSHSDPLLMQQSEASPFRHIYSNYDLGELRQIFCKNHSWNIYWNNQAMNIY